MDSLFVNMPHHQSRSPHGERGLKYMPRGANVIAKCRSPHGERGLKSKRAKFFRVRIRSLPTRGAWIEISAEMSIHSQTAVAPHTGSVD